MARKTTRRIVWMDPIQNASTKFALVREKAGLNNGGIKYFGSRIFNTRDQKGGTIQASGFYMRKYARTTPLSQKEIKVRMNFMNGLEWAKEASQNLSVVTWNQEQFLIVYKDRTKSCGGIYYTNENGWLGYLRAYAMQTLNHDGTLPENYKLPAAE